ncbi:hypothetical protein [Micromonospora zhanjiangensis]
MDGQFVGAQRTPQLDGEEYAQRRWGAARGRVGSADTDLVARSLPVSGGGLLDADRCAGQAGQLAQDRVERGRHGGQVDGVGGVQADRDRRVAAHRPIADGTVVGRVVQGGNSDHAVRVELSGAGQRGRGADGQQTGRSQGGGAAAQPSAAGAGGQTQHPEQRRGESGEEHQLDDRQVGQVAVERGDALVRAGLPGAGDQRGHLPGRMVAVDELRGEFEREERADRDQRRGESAGAQRPGGEAERGERGQARGTDRGRPPQRAAPGALPGGAYVQDSHTAQVCDQRPAGGGGPTGELADPSRPGGAGQQIGHAVAGLPRTQPGGGADHDGHEGRRGAGLHGHRADVPQWWVRHGRPIRDQPEERGDDRQHPPCHVAAQFQPEQPAARRQRQPDSPGRPDARRPDRRGAHEFAAASTAL